MPTGNSRDTCDPSWTLFALSGFSMFKRAGRWAPAPSTSDTAAPPSGLVCVALDRTCVWAPPPPSQSPSPPECHRLTSGGLFTSLTGGEAPCMQGLHFLKYFLLDFRPRWRRRQTRCASSHNQKKDNNKFKHKKQPELTENQTVWKSDRKDLKKKHSPRPAGGAETGSSWWTR